MSTTNPARRDNIAIVSTRYLSIVALSLACGCASDSVEPPPISGARQLVRVAHLELPAAPTAIVARDGIAYLGCGEAGVVIVDVREPRAPEILARLESVRADALAYSEDRLFALARAAGLGSEAGLTAIDVVDPREPLALEWRAIDDACCVAAATARAAVGAGARLHVGAETRRPVSRVIADDGETVVAAWWRGERIAAITATEVRWLGREKRHAKLEFFDFKTAPRGELALGEASAVRCGDGDVVLDAHAAYAVIGGRLHVVALRPDVEPRSSATLAIPGARAIALGRGFVALAGDSLSLVDLDANPSLADRITLDAPAHDVAVSGDFVLVVGARLGLRVYSTERTTPVPSDGSGPE